MKLLFASLTAFLFLFTTNAIAKDHDGKFNQSNNGSVTWSGTGIVTSTHVPTTAGGRLTPPDGRPIPEPTAALAFGAGLLILAGATHRKRD